MNYRDLASNAAVAFASQLVGFLTSFVTSLVVPKFLGVEDYGYWQLFIFYSTYVGVFSLGATDGLYLLKGGITRAEVDKRDVASQYWCSSTIVLMLSFVFSLVLCGFVSERERVAVLLLTAVYSVLSHLSSSLGYVFQAMNETKLYSRSVVVDRGSFLVSLLVLLVLRVDDFVPYIILYIASKGLCVAYCAWNARDILRCAPYPLPETLGRTLKSIRVGISLMFAGFADMLILGVARFLVDGVWGIEVFGRVSFALSLVNFFITFVTQASMVLFPSLRQSDEGERRSFYRGVRDAMSVLFPAVYIFYFPMTWLVGLWLPQYAESLSYFAILLPICVFNGEMQICCVTYFKVLREERALFAINVATVALSTVASLVGIYVLSSLEAVLVGVVACIAIREVYSEWRLNRCLGVPSSGLKWMELGLAVAFALIASSTSLLLGAVLYAATYAINLVVNRGRVQLLVNRARGVLRG